MDAIGLTVLLKELEADCSVAQEAARKSGLRLQKQGPGYLEACAYEPARLYNVLEKMLERICEEFEKRGDYHERLIQRLSLDLEGLRPAFIPEKFTAEVRELKGFRHVFRHAYDLTIKAERLSELSRIAQSIAGELPHWCSAFGANVRAEQGWS